MAYRDLRAWIARLEQEDLLRRITAEVDWSEEIGAISSRVTHRRGPALLFENIRDYQSSDCGLLFSSSLGTFGRIALAMGLAPDTPFLELMQVFRKRTRDPLRPIDVQGGTVKEVVHEGADANILEFPIPKWSDGDGGRYVTFGTWVSRDPETGNVNLGIYRGQVHDERTIGIYAAADKHIMRHYAKYQRLGQDMPVAIVIGGNPLLPVAGAAPYGLQASEYDLLGGLCQEPVEVARCETSDLVVPADAEIVLEGTMPIDPRAYRVEGPFAEFTGYYTSEPTPRPVARIRCITHRRRPIYQGTLRAKPVDESHVMDSLTASCFGWEVLEMLGIPGILDVYSPPCAALTDVRVRIKKMYQGHAKQVANALWAARPSHFKNVIVVDEDIDIHDADQLEWAFAYRVDAKDDGVVVFPGTPGMGLDPSTDPRWRDYAVFGRARWNRLLIDATKEWRWGPREEWGGDRYPPVAEMSQEARELIDRRWSEYGL